MTLSRVQMRGRRGITGRIGLAVSLSSPHPGPFPQTVQVSQPQQLDSRGTPHPGSEEHRAVRECTQARTQTPCALSGLETAGQATRMCPLARSYTEEIALGAWLRLQILHSAAACSDMHVWGRWSESGGGCRSDQTVSFVSVVIFLPISTIVRGLNRYVEPTQEEITSTKCRKRQCSCTLSSG